MIARIAREIVQIAGMLMAAESRNAAAFGSVYYVTRNIKTKGGTEFTPDDVLRVSEYTRHYPYLVKLETSDNRKLSLPVERAWTVLRNFPKPPSLNMMAKWELDGRARSVDGNVVEPDGWSPHGSPSWLIVMGLI